MRAGQRGGRGRGGPGAAWLAPERLCRRARVRAWAHIRRARSWKVQTGRVARAAGGDRSGGSAQVLRTERPAAPYVPAPPPPATLPARAPRPATAARYVPPSRTAPAGCPGPLGAARGRCSRPPRSLGSAGRGGRGRTLRQRCCPPARTARPCRRRGSFLARVSFTTVPWDAIMVFPGPVARKDVQVGRKRYVQSRGSLQPPGSGSGVALSLQRRRRWRPGGGRQPLAVPSATRSWGKSPAAWSESATLRLPARMLRRRRPRASRSVFGEIPFGEALSPSVPFTGPPIGVF